MFDFVDLFAGVGGFHAAMAGLGGRAVQAAEIDPVPAAVYERNWGLKPFGDVRLLSSNTDAVADHAVLTGGFPCQPFSKSGRQLGIDEDRGTLFFDIAKILEARRPPVVMLENVRNIAGPRQRIAWLRLIHGLRKAGYRVSSEPCVFSPHLLSPEDGGSAQIRERVYILGVFVGAEAALRQTLDAPPVTNQPQNGWSPDRWSMAEHVILDDLPGEDLSPYQLRADEVRWLDTWNDLIRRLPRSSLPGFPLWEQSWAETDLTTPDMPTWKSRILTNNARFYARHRNEIDDWRELGLGRDLHRFPASRRKLEWQAQDSTHDLWQLAIQLRPSGIRVKRPTYVPALVAMNQTTIYGPLRRRLTPRETAKLQGFDTRTFEFGQQPDAASYKQMGNAVNAGAASYVFRKFVELYAEEIRLAGPSGDSIVESVLNAPVERRSEEVA